MGFGSEPFVGAELIIFVLFVGASGPSLPAFLFLLLPATSPAFASSSSAVFPAVVSISLMLEKKSSSSDMTMDEARRGEGFLEILLFLLTDLTQYWNAKH